MLLKPPQHADVRESFRSAPLQGNADFGALGRLLRPAINSEEKGDQQKSD